MSASNWAVCPRCTASDEAQAEHNRKAVADLYGKVSVEEFDAARAGLESALIDLLDEEGHRTFHEDYEIYGASSGVITVSYGGSCEHCGLSLDFTSEHPIPEAPATDRNADPS